MSTRQRIMRYLLGLFIGAVMVFFMFPNYDWLSWTPNKTLMKQIRESRMEVTARGLCMLDCTGLGNDQIQVIRNNGKVDFSRSDAHATPRRYHVHYGESAFDVLVTDSLIMLDGVETVNSAACNCR